MSGAPISLSDIAHQIPSNDADFHQQTVADLLGRRSLGFPGAQPVSFSRHHLLELRNTDYFMCEKTDGIRCLMFLTEIAGAEAQFLIDRKNDYYYVLTDSLHLPVPGNVGGHHLGTLLDGELVRQSWKDKQGNPHTRLAYLIFDLLAIDGENITQKQFDKRLARLQERVVKPFKEFKARYPEDVAAQPFQVEMKRMEFPYGFEQMFRQTLPSLPHGNDGLIFTSREDPYTFGTDQKILKWKPPLENTIDFRLLLGAFPMLTDDEGAFEDWDAMPEMELHVNHGGGQSGYRYFANLTLNDDEWEALKRSGKQIDGRVIECYGDPAMNGDVWRPKLDDGMPRFRDDTKDANHISTVESVLESIKGAVTEEDLIAESGNIRTPFKARQKAREDAEKRRVEEERRKVAEVPRRRESTSTATARAEDDDVGPVYTDE